MKSKSFSEPMTEKKMASLIIGPSSGSVMCRKR